MALMCNESTSEHFSKKCPLSLDQRDLISLHTSVIFSLLSLTHPPVEGLTNPHEHKSTRTVKFFQYPEGKKTVALSEPCIASMWDIPYTKPHSLTGLYTHTHTHAPDVLFLLRHLSPLESALHLSGPYKSPIRAERRGFRQHVLYVRDQSQWLATVFTDRCDSETVLFIQQLGAAQILPSQAAFILLCNYTDRCWAVLEMHIKIIVDRVILMLINGCY